MLIESRTDSEVVYDNKVLCCYAKGASEIYGITAALSYEVSIFRAILGISLFCKLTQATGKCVYVWLFGRKTGVLEYVFTHGIIYHTYAKLYSQHPFENPPLALCFNLPKSREILVY